MRLVVDTIVFVSAALKEASPPASVVRWVDRRGGLLKTLATEPQLIDILQRPAVASRLPPMYFEHVLRLLAAAESISITERIVACRDPHGRQVSRTAVSGDADMIVTGDLDLLTLHPFRGIPIIDPGMFFRSIVASP